MPIGDPDAYMEGSAPPVSAPSLSDTELGELEQRGVISSDTRAAIKGGTLDRKTGKDFDVLIEFGGDRPGQMLEGREGLYYKPQSGPLADNLVRMEKGADVDMLRDFLQAPEDLGGGF